MKKKDVKFQEQKQLKQSIRGKPKYVEKLILEAEKRKRQNDVWYEKKLQREQEAEREAFGDTEKFVTPSYKRHLEELKAFEEKQEKEEAKNAARNQKGMAGFYSNMLGFGRSGSDEKEEEKEEEKKETEKSQVKEEPLEPPIKRQATEEPAVREMKLEGGESVKEETGSTGLDLQNAVGAKEYGAEVREKELEELNKSKLTQDKTQSAKERYLARKRAAAEMQPNNKP
jgi:hypothetical protein